MGSAGLEPIPFEEPMLVSAESLAEFDRLMEQGGIEAVITAVALLSLRCAVGELVGG